MKLSTATALLVANIAIGASALNISYSVISLVPDNQTVGVLVDSQLYPLTSVNEASALLHTGEAPAATSGYTYVVLDKTNTSYIIDRENFTRSPVSSGNTPNEFYGRPWNSMNLTQLPVIMEPLPIIHRVDSDLHIDGEIPTIHITGNQSAVDYIHKHPDVEMDLTDMKMTYISPSDIKTYSDVTFAVSGQSTRFMKKLSYKLNLRKKDDLYKYRRFKLRAMETDPSYMRESLALDIAASIGLPTNKLSYVRVFINNQAMGLFGIIDNFKSPWIANEFADGDKKAEHGGLVIADINIDPSINTAKYPNVTHVSDLAYVGDNASLYNIPYPTAEAPSSGKFNYTRLMDLTKFISEQPTANASDSVVPLWEEKMDVVSFLRGLALEVVISDIDGYIAGANNFLLYDDIANERIVYSLQDFDLTMGTIYSDFEAYLSGNYTEFPSILVRPLSASMLAVPKFRLEFDNLVRNFTTGLVNPEVMNPRIDSLVAMLSQDVAWDKSLPRAAAEVNIGFDAMANITLKNMPFLDAVNGPTHTNISMGLREWLTRRTENFYHYFNQTSVSIVNE